ncbi:MAG: gephyrin-like molybdotransferase Glp [Pseudomonadota bacterium]
MLSVTEARRRIVDGLQPVGTEMCSLAQTHGRVIAAPITAMITQPPATMAAMDGYAFRSHEVTDIPATFPIAGTVAAGDVPEAGYPLNQAIRILTGAVMPEGFDLVVPQEDTEADDETVTIHQAAEPGRHIRPRGQDFAEGDQAFAPGHLLSARDIGLMAAMNVTWAPVYRQPVIGLLATGDEILLPGEPLRDAAIIGSSGPALEALLKGWGCRLRHLGVAADNLPSLTQAIEAAAGVDLLVTTGGVSVGTHDLIRALVADEPTNPAPGHDGQLDGAVHSQLDFWRLAMRPGKPLLWGRVEGMPILGLPGNPVSALVCGLLFLYPAIQKLRGTPVQAMPQHQAVLSAPLPANGPREHYLRATISVDDNQLIASPCESQDSARMAILSHSDGLIVHPKQHPALAKGDAVSVIRFRDIHGF